jgi:hypothetical protein
MDVETLLAALRRHWRAVLVMLAVTAVAVAVVPRRIAAEFEVKGDVVLLSPSTVDSGIGGSTNVNPWSRFGGAESGAAAALVTIMDGAQIKAEILSDPNVKSFDIGISRTNGAIVGLVVIAADPASAMAGYERALGLLTGELERRQQEAGADESTWLRVDALTRPSRAEELPGSRTRVMLAVAALGAVASVGSAVALDVVVSARRHEPVTNGSTRVSPPAEPPPATAPEAEAERTEVAQRAESLFGRRPAGGGERPEANGAPRLSPTLFDGATPTKASNGILAAHRERGDG